MYHLFGRFRGNAINLQSVYELSRQRHKTYQK